MKTKNLLPAKAKPITPEVIEPTALTVKSSRMPKIKGKTPGQRINFLHKLSVASGKLSIAAGILAGWELQRAKAKCDHGQWLVWLDANTDISPMTATRYMSVYAMTIGATRAAMPEPISQNVQPSMAELNEAAANVDAPTLNGLYKQLKILKGNPDHGGARENAGRKAKGAAEVAEEEMVELDKIAETPAAAWATVRDHLRPLQDAQRDRHVFDHLDLVELAEAHNILRSLFSDAEAALKRFEKV